MLEFDRSSIPYKLHSLIEYSRYGGSWHEVGRKIECLYYIHFKQWLLGKRVKFCSEFWNIIVRIKNDDYYRWLDESIGSSIGSSSA